MKTISLIIPVFNNSNSIKLLFEKLSELANKLKKNLKLNLELVFIDDGSSDDSLMKLISNKRNYNNYFKDIKIIKLTRNFGGVNAVKIGFNHISSDAFSMLACDLQDPPELIYDMARLWKEGSKFIVCERVSRDDPFLKRLLSKIYYLLINIFVFKDYPKGGYDLALMDKIFLPLLQNSAKETFPPILAFWLGIKPEIIKYHRLKRREGKSSWTFLKRINSFFNTMYGFSVTPVRLMTLIGLFISFLSFIYGAFIFYIAMTDNISVPGFSTLAILILFLFGIVILFLGIIGEYVWKILNQINNRPDAVIDEIF